MLVRVKNTSLTYLLIKNLTNRYYNQFDTHLQPYRQLEYR